MTGPVVFNQSYWLKPLGTVGFAFEAKDLFSLGTLQKGNVRESLIQYMLLSLSILLQGKVVLCI